ncbi:MAG: hypothetical protein KDD04_08050, partial [Sinomicrobium sp.]|nr:hypothetical protein [Sinomicrobium sp.]
MKTRGAFTFCFTILRRAALGMERLPGRQTGVSELLKHGGDRSCFASPVQTDRPGTIPCFKASSDSPAPACGGGNALKKTFRNADRYKVQAGALQFVVLISVVITVFLAAFVLLTHTHTFFKKQSYTLVETVKNADNGIRYALESAVNLNDSVALPAFGGAGETVTVHRSYWGVFEKVTAVSGNRNKRFAKMALTGGRFALNEHPALYLKDNNKPLIVAGSTKIEGTVYLPGEAVRPGNIAGHAYHGGSLIYGTIRKSHGQLPALSPELTAQLDMIARQGFDPDAEDMINPETEHRTSNSFAAPVHYLYSPGTIDLGGMSMSGNIVVYSRKKIVVTATARLNDVVLAAPEIEIRDGVTGCFQAIGSEKIDVGRQVTLHYPSALVLNPAKTGEGVPEKVKNGIFINENSLIKGVVVFHSKETAEQNVSAQVTLEPGAAVYGELYCTGNLEL